MTDSRTQTPLTVPNPSQRKQGDGSQPQKPPSDKPLTTEESLVQTLLSMRETYVAHDQLPVQETQADHRKSELCGTNKQLQNLVSRAIRQNHGVQNMETLDSLLVSDTLVRILYLPRQPIFSYSVPESSQPCPINSVPCVGTLGPMLPPREDIQGHDFRNDETPQHHPRPAYKSFFSVWEVPWDSDGLSSKLWWLQPSSPGPLVWLVWLHLCRTAHETWETDVPSAKNLSCSTSFQGASYWEAGKPGDKANNVGRCRKKTWFELISLYFFYIAWTHFSLTWGVSITCISIAMHGHLNTSTTDASVICHLHRMAPLLITWFILINHIAKCSSHTSCHTWECNYFPKLHCFCAP